jgi:MFS family permease
VSGGPLFTRAFRLYLTSRFCAGSAMMLLRAAVAWQVFALSQSAFHLGLVGVIQFLPALALTLVAGAVADSFQRRRVIVAAQVPAFLCVAVLAAATLSGRASLPLIYTVVFLVAAATAFDLPSRAALLPTLVPRVQFARAVTVGSTIQALAFVTGPAIGGILIAAAGVGAAYVTYGVLMLGSVAALAALPATGVRAGPSALTVAAVREGLSFVRRSQVLLGCMMVDMLAVIFGGATALLPIYAQEILRVGARGYGVLTAASEAGALVASVALLALPPVRRTGRTLLLAVVFFGLATIVFGLSTSFPLSLAAYVVVGLADQVSVVMRSTMIQLATPDQLRGRVSAVNFLFIGASNQLGAAESGFVAALTSAPFAVVGGGIACLVVVAVVAITMPELRRYRVELATSTVRR